MRGKPAASTCWRALSGITPAYAGKTVVKHINGLRTEDHPRVCGENKSCSGLPHRRRGSPPRMRGKRRFGQYASRATRITPAYAGKTAARTARVGTCQDHPRVCGENAGKVNLSHVVDGSPPRMRGKRREFETGAVRDRITPAYAGKTLPPQAQNVRL